MEEKEFLIYPKQFENQVNKKIKDNFQRARNNKSAKLQKLNKKSHFKKFNPYTQRHLSERLNEKCRFVQELEEGKIELNLLLFINLCNALRIKSSDILGDFITEDNELNDFQNLDENTQEIINEFISSIKNDIKMEKSNFEVDNFNNELLIKRIIGFCESKNISLRELNKRIDRSHSFINNMNQLKIADFVKICNALDCSPNDLLKPFFNKQDSDEYVNLDSKNKFLVDTLIKICNNKQQKTGYVKVKKAAPKEVKNNKYTPKMSKEEWDRYYKDMEKYNLY